tara:strand:- start:90 stop:227 length:138 start_codon:yes stop_codon:yes gene_type:complete
MSLIDIHKLEVHFTLYLQAFLKLGFLLALSLALFETIDVACVFSQ